MKMSGKSKVWLLTVGREPGDRGECNAGRVVPSPDEEPGC